MAESFRLVLRHDGSCCAGRGGRRGAFAGRRFIDSKENGDRMVCGCMGRTSEGKFVFDVMMLLWRILGDAGKGKRGE